MNHAVDVQNHLIVFRIVLLDIVGISNDIMHSILTEELSMKKIIRAFRVSVAKTESFECLENLWHVFAFFTRRFVTINKIWVHLYIRKIKEQFKQCVLRFSTTGKGKKGFAFSFYQVLMEDDEYYTNLLQ